MLLKDTFAVAATYDEEKYKLSYRTLPVYCIYL